MTVCIVTKGGPVEAVGKDIFEVCSNLQKKLGEEFTFWEVFDYAKDGEYVLLPCSEALKERFENGIEVRYVVENDIVNEVKSMSIRNWKQGDKVTCGPRGPGTIVRAGNGDNVVVESYDGHLTTMSLDELEGEEIYGFRWGNDNVVVEANNGVCAGYVGRPETVQALHDMLDDMELEEKPKTIAHVTAIVQESRLPLSIGVCGPGEEKEKKTPKTRDQMERTVDDDGTVRYDGFVNIKESIDNKMKMMLEAEETANEERRVENMTEDEDPSPEYWEEKVKDLEERAESVLNEKEE